MEKIYWILGGIGVFCCLILLSFVVFVSIVDTGDSDATTSAQVGIGEQLVYDRIDSITDCEELQEGFDRTMNDVEWRQPGDEIRKISLAYANYYDKRMRSLGCY